MIQIYIVRDRATEGKIYGVFKNLELAKNLKAYLLRKCIPAGIDEVDTDLMD